MQTVLSDQSHVTGGICAQTTPISHIPLQKLQQTAQEMEGYPLWGDIYLSCSLPPSLQLTHGYLVIWEVKSLFTQNQCLTEENIEKPQG